MTRDSSFIVVGLGGSAGAIEALEGFFKAMPTDSGMAFVVAMHFPAAAESHLADILARHTAMPVAAIRGGETIEPNRVYTVPPGHGAIFAGGCFHLRRSEVEPAERGGIDALFSALAQELGERAVGIVLSGTGSDGALGLKAIKEKGGLTLAQGPDGAQPRYGGMPASAVAAGGVDLVLPVERMPAQLRHYAETLGTLTGMAAGEPQPGKAEALAEAHRAITELLQRQVGHDFSGYKEKTFWRRVHRRMQVLQITDLDAYVERLRQSREEVMALFRDLLISVTDFFRDPPVFQSLAELVVPRLFEGKSEKDIVRVWVPGCATGEEAYTLAILLCEHMGTLAAAPKLQIFATDIDDDALAVARAGRYPASLVSTVSPERLQRFFVEQDGTYAVSKQIRDLCIFSPHSVIRDPPFSRMDLISCRNLLIYLDATMQARVIPVFHYALRPGGFLLLGGSESVLQFPDLFQPVHKKHRIFVRRDLAIPRTEIPLLVGGMRSASAAGTAGRPNAGPHPLSVLRAAELRVLERFAPAHVVVNREGEIVHYSARTGRYLEQPPGQPTRELLAQARRGLRPDLRIAFKEAVRDRRTVRRDNVRFENGDGAGGVELLVEPLGEAEGNPLFLVVFIDKTPARADAAAMAEASQDHDAVIEQLEAELREARERLQSMSEEYDTSVEELRSANEEMVSINEELQSTNEELETSKEELQSVNEELHTVNNELRIKIDQLDHANNDLHNLFKSTRIATIFLDRDLVVRSFTPASAEIFHLIASDRGRPLTDLMSRLDYADLTADCRAVLASREPLERRLGRQDGKAHYLMRLHPYLTGDDQVTGVVLTFVDVTRLVEAEQQQRLLLAELQHRVKNILANVRYLSAETRRRSASLEEFAEAFEGRLDALATAQNLLTRHNVERVDLEELVREEILTHTGGRQDRVAVSGPEILLSAKAAQALGLAVHELATNAVKHGALAVDGGRIDLAWNIEPAGDGRALRIDWVESGIALPETPGERGFGSELIEEGVPYMLGGSARLQVSPEGLRCTIAVPVGPQTVIPATDDDPQGDDG